MWPDETKILSLMRVGFTYSEAFHMSPRDARRYTAIQYASSISQKEREEGTRAATAADVAAL